MRNKYEYKGLWFILPSLLGVMVFILLPFMDVVRRSFMGAVNGRWVGLANYRNVLGNQAFLLAAGNTARFAVVCIPLLISLSLFTAVFLQRYKTWGGWLKSAYLVPMAIPVASVVLLWRVLFDRQGILNGGLSLLGLPARDWMNAGTAFGVLVFSYIWKNLGYDVVLWMAGLSSIPESLGEAARVDGANEWQCFWRITLPNLMPTLFTITVLSFLNSFKVFREAYLVAGNYPDQSMYLMQHLFNNWFRDLDMDKMAAGAVLMSLVILALVLLLQKAWGGDE